jgi:hypothetical protein
MPEEKIEFHPKHFLCSKNIEHSYKIKPYNLMRIDLDC